MSQSAVILPGSPLTGAQAAADMNAAWQAMISQFSGTSAPTLGAGSGGSLEAGQTWLNTTATLNILGIYDGAQFVSCLSLDTSLHVVGGLFSGITVGGPSTKTANYTVTNSDTSLIFNGSGTITATLPSAASFPGRLLYLKTIAGQAVISASANVVPLAGGAAGTAILSGTAGQFVLLQSDATNWNIIQQNAAAAAANVFTVLNVSANTTLSFAAEQAVNVNASGGARTITLYAPSAPNSGGFVRVKKTDSSSNNVIVNVSGGGNIDGVTSVVINSQYQSIDFVTDSSQWWTY